MPNIKPLDSIQSLNVDIQKAIRSIPVSNRYYIALSGGLDSLALLYFCLPYLKRHTQHVHAIHIHHGLSPNADVWSEFCQDVCQQLGVDCHVEKVVVAKKGKGVEAEARKARYAVFKRYLSEGGVLLQGHHLNDQAETVLMRVFRGLGPEAIKAIPQMRTLSLGCLYRPWLTIPRELLSVSFEGTGMAWIEDESNLDTRFERNYLRHKILPVLKERRPSILNDLARTARKSKESVDFIQQWCEANKNKFLSTDYTRYQAIDLTVFNTYSAIQQKFIIRFWLDLQGVEHPNENNFKRIFDELLIAKNASQAEVSWSSYALRVFNDALFCLSASQLCSVNCDGYKPLTILLAELKQTLKIQLPSGMLSLDLIEESLVSSFYSNEKTKHVNSQAVNVYELLCAIPESVNELTVRYRAGGEKIYFQENHSTLLKKLYQTRKVLPWVREKLPLIYSADDLLCSMAGFTAAPYSLDSAKKHKSARKLVRFRFDLS